ncbi:MAG TPA: DCC1-like thiol-disulfide oxidoreductase family protein [Terriglobales bacterium]|nr:DCC1-like thiol-disulfide oxidoreductase family protein [Terriglobales bacterium]
MISLVSELTDRKSRHARGWLFYDAECAFCTRIAHFLAGPMRRRRLAVAALQDPRVGALLGLPREELLCAVRFVFEDGRHCAGADALLAVAGELWWARPLASAARIPGMLPALRAGYRWGSAQWNCHANYCAAASLSFRG